jgi:hypothetical protein
MTQEISPIATAAKASAAVEQNTLKRRGLGLRACDPERACPRYTVFAPCFPQNRTVFLIDLQGSIVHTWTMPYAPGLGGYLTERGSLIYFFTPRMGNAQRLPNGNTLINEACFGRFFEVTPQGETVWEYVNPYFGGPPKRPNEHRLCRLPLHAGRNRRGTVHRMRERLYATPTRN